MDKTVIPLLYGIIPFIFLDVNGWHMMDWDYHMMDWWGVPFFGFWWIGIWIIQFIIGLIIYKDAERHNENSIMWLVLSIIPWIGWFIIIYYIIFRNEEDDKKEVITDAHKTLDERYAKGEISREEYLQAIKDIVDNM